MGFADELAGGLESFFGRIARFLKRHWFVSCVVFPVVVYLGLLFGDVWLGQGFYNFIRSSLEDTGVFTNPYFLKAASLTIFAVSWAFLPTLLLMVLRFRQKKVTLIVGGAFVVWTLFLGILAQISRKGPFGPEGTPECKYFMNSDGTVALRPKEWPVDQQTGKKLEIADDHVIEQWRAQNPGKIASCSFTAVSPSHTPNPIRIPDARTYRWFGPDGALVWYAQDSDGSYRYYDGPGRDPILDGELKPVTRDVVLQAVRAQDERDKTKASNAAADAERARAQKKAEQRELKNLQTAEEREKLKQETVRRRQVNAQGAERAFAAGDYDLALIDCPDVKQDIQDDPCTSVHQKAAQKKVAVLIKQSKENVRKYKLDDAIQDAAEALKWEPGNEEAKTVLHYAQGLKRTDGSPNQ